MFDKHLSESKVTYLSHLGWALLAGVRLIFSGFASIIHGFVPTLFNGTTPRTIIDIYHSHLENHPNNQYKDMINEARKKYEKKN